MLRRELGTGAAWWQSWEEPALGAHPAGSEGANGGEGAVESRVDDGWLAQHRGLGGPSEEVFIHSNPSQYLFIVFGGIP